MKPDFVRGYSSGIISFCKLIEAKGYSIDFKIKGVYLTSENFSKSDKKYISEILNCPVWGQYGHTVKLARLL